VPSAAVMVVVEGVAALKEEGGICGRRGERKEKARDVRRVFGGDERVGRARALETGRAI